MGEMFDDAGFVGDEENKATASSFYNFISLIAKTFDYPLTEYERVAKLAAEEAEKAAAAAAGEIFADRAPPRPLESMIKSLAGYDISYYKIDSITF